MNNKSLDLNLLPVLKQLLETRHVTRVAGQLNISQPSVSRALQHLRSAFNDPLLVRTQNGYDLTARAQSLLPQLQQLTDSIDSVTSPSEFNPAKAIGTIKFFGLDPEVVSFLPPLFSLIRQEAPGVSLEVHSKPRDHFDLLDSGDVHFCISALTPTTNTDQYHQLVLTEAAFVCVMHSNHPLANSPLTLEHYLNSSHGLVSITGHDLGLIDRRLTELGKRRQIALKLQNFSSVARFCESSDLMFLIPQNIAQQIIKGHSLVIKPAPKELDLNLNHFHLYWHKRYHLDPMCIWIRNRLRATLVK